MGYWWDKEGKNIKQQHR